MLERITALKKATPYFIVVLLCLLLVLPYVAPALAQTSINVNVNVSDVNGNGYPDITFTATNAIGQPQGGVTIEVTPDASPGPLYTNSTDSSGKFIFKDMPPDTYTWTCAGQSGTVYLDSLLLH